MRKSPFLKGFQFAAVLSCGAALLICANALMPIEAQVEPPRSPSTPVQAPSETSSSTNEVPAAATIEPRPLPPALKNLSPGLAEVIRLLESNVSEEVLIAYIESARFAFKPSVDEILYLNDLGVSDKVITTLLNRSKETEALAQTAPQQTNAVAAASQPVTEVSNAVTETAAEIQAPAPGAATEIAVIEEPETVVNINYFQEPLSPYGNWLTVEEYGLCWQPAVVVSDPHWRPYCDRGRWIYSNHGWYWQSDYSWGWAAFHYGRWHRSNRCGWVWVPDRTWGPSWVSWRYTDDHCGWAPLPPSARFRSSGGLSYWDSHVSVRFDFGLSRDCYTFVPRQRFCDPHPNRHRVSIASASAIFERSRVHNNYSVNNHRVVNHGLAPSAIAGASGNEIRQVTIRPSSAPVKGDVLDKNSNTLVAYRPDMAPATHWSRQPSGRGSQVATSQPTAKPLPMTSITQPQADRHTRPAVAPSPNPIREAAAPAPVVYTPPTTVPGKLFGRPSAVAQRGADSSTIAPAQNQPAIAAAPSYSAPQPHAVQGNQFSVSPARVFGKSPTSSQQHTVSTRRQERTAPVPSAPVAQPAPSIRSTQPSLSTRQAAPVIATPAPPVVHRAPEPRPVAAKVFQRAPTTVASSATPASRPAPAAPHFQVPTPSVAPVAAPRQAVHAPPAAVARTPAAAPVTRAAPPARAQVAPPTAARSAGARHAAPVAPGVAGRQSKDRP